MVLPTHPDLQPAVCVCCAYYYKPDNLSEKRTGKLAPVRCRVSVSVSVSGSGWDSDLSAEKEASSGPELATRIET